MPGAPLRTWTKETKVGVIHDAKGKEVEEDRKLAYMRRYRELCDKLFKLAAEVSHSEEETALFSKFLDEAMEKIRILRLRRAQVTNEISDPIAPSSMDMSQPTGINKRLGLKRKRYLKNSVKLCNYRKISSSKSMSQPIIKYPQSQQSIIIEASSQPQDGKGHGVDH